jgi:hypothetical protein
MATVPATARARLSWLSGSQCFTPTMIWAARTPQRTDPYTSRFRPPALAAHAASGLPTSAIRELIPTVIESAAGERNAPFPRLDTANTMPSVTDIIQLKTPPRRTCLSTSPVRALSSLDIIIHLRQAGDRALRGPEGPSNTGDKLQGPRFPCRRGPCQLHPLVRRLRGHTSSISPTDASPDPPTATQRIAGLSGSSTS